MTTPHDEVFEIAHDVEQSPMQSKFGPWIGAGAFDLDRVPIDRPNVDALTILSQACQWLTERATEVLPTIAAESLDDACSYVQAVLRADTDTLRTMLDHAWIDVDSAHVDLLAELLDAEQSAQAWQSPLVPFTTTAGHTPTHTGEYRTFRRRLVVTGEGVTGYGHELATMADQILLAFTDQFSADGAPILGTMALIGSQDVAPNQVVEYRPDVLSWVRSKAGEVIGTWNDYHDQIQGRHARPSSGVVGGRADRRNNGGNRRHTPHSRQPIARQGRKRVLDVSRVIVGKPRDPSNNMPVCSWRNPELVTTTYAGRSITGHGSWVAPTRKARKASDATIARRAASTARVARLAPSLTIDPQELASVIAQRCGALESSEVPAPTSTLRLAMTDGSKVAIVRLDGRGYRLTLTRTDRSRSTWTRSTPGHLASTVRNYQARQARLNASA